MPASVNRPCLLFLVQRRLSNLTNAAYNMPRKTWFSRVGLALVFARMASSEASSSTASISFEVFGKVQGGAPAARGCCYHRPNGHSPRLPRACPCAVFFRKYTQQHGATLGLRGWVMNTPSGTVVGEATGPSAAIANMSDWLKTKGSPKSRIDKAVIKQLEAQPASLPASFEIKR